MLRPTGRRTGWALAAIGIGLSVLAATAAGEEPTRDEYVSRLESICEPGSKATKRAMQGVRDDVRKGRDAVAAQKFDEGARIFGETVGTISAVPRPSADSGRLKTWFVYLDRQEGYLREIADQLRAGRNIRAQRLLSRFIHNGNLANNVTLAFEFDYCAFRFSRFG